MLLGFETAVMLRRSPGQTPKTDSTVLAREALDLTPSLFAKSPQQGRYAVISFPDLPSELLTKASQLRAIQHNMNYALSFITGA